MRTFDYICMELHYYSSDGSNQEIVKSITAEALESLKETHRTEFETHTYFYASKIQD